ncbi:PHP domain-containing protein [Alistipes ihumii]|uniref:PHP domain-containing protein n=5 Tax=Rikenellaceae TaxID=171550 RepID=UPI003AAD6F17
MKKILIPVLLLGSLSLSGQIRNDEVFELPEMEISDLRNDIRIPDVDGFHVLKCDFHTHTIFSDGRVWPTMRVDEAWKDGLDAIAITDHIEVRPWKPFVSGGDLNSSFDIAKQRADQIGFIVIKGIEITRAKPLGHINALFITDANPIETPEPLDAVNEAYRQGAFIMWNHPGWPDDRCTMYDVHEQLIKEGKIHGVEVFNSAEYYPKAIDWCRDLKLAFLANSDIHSTTGDSYHPKPLGRPVTLVLAKERSEAGIREAMFAGRTIALFDDLLAGPEALLTGLVKASIDRRVISSDEQGELVELTNRSDIPFRGTVEGRSISLPAGKTIRTRLPARCTIKMKNCYTGNGQALEIAYPFQSLAPSRNSRSGQFHNKGRMLLRSNIRPLFRSARRADVGRSPRHDRSARHQAAFAESQAAAVPAIVFQSGCDRRSIPGTFCSPDSCRMILIRRARNDTRTSFSR